MDLVIIVILLVRLVHYQQQIVLPVKMGLSEILQILVFLIVEMASMVVQLVDFVKNVLQIALLVLDQVMINVLLVLKVLLELLNVYLRNQIALLDNTFK
jgi:hypothetical protein